MSSQAKPSETGPDAPPPDIPSLPFWHAHRRLVVCALLFAAAAAAWRPMAYRSAWPC